MRYLGVAYNDAVGAKAYTVKSHMVEVDDA